MGTRMRGLLYLADQVCNQSLEILGQQGSVGVAACRDAFGCLFTFAMVCCVDVGLAGKGFRWCCRDNDYPMRVPRLPRDDFARLYGGCDWMPDPGPSA